MIVFRSAGVTKAGSMQYGYRKFAIVLWGTTKQNNNLDEYSDDSDAESEKVRKAKKAKKPDNEKWSSSLICNLIDEYEARPCLWNIFCDDYHNRDVTGKAKKELEVSQSELHHEIQIPAIFVYNRAR